MSNPFQNSSYNDLEDQQLIKEALSGSGDSLEALIKRHQHYVYNIAIKMVLSPFDAEDITQEVLIKVMTNLSQFKSKSTFRTWVYRITVNHFLKMKKSGLEESITTFQNYGEELDRVENVELTEDQKIENEELIEPTFLTLPKYFQFYVIFKMINITFSLKKAII